MGQTLQATFTYADANGKQEQTSKSFLVTAIMKPSGNNFIDNSVIINLDAGDQLLHKSEKYDAVTVMASSPQYVNAVQQELKGQFGETLGIVTPKAIMAVREQTASGNAMFVFMIGLIALIVGAVGIVTTLYNSVTERVREIGTLKAIGAQNTDILSLFIVEAILIGIIGATLGLVIGVGGGYVLGMFGSHAGPGPEAHIQPIFAVSDLAKVWLLSVALSMTAGVFPAWKASKLSPLVALRRD